MGQYLKKRNINFLGSNRRSDIFFVNLLDVLLKHLRNHEFTCDLLGSASVRPFSVSPIPSKSSTTDIIKIDATVLVLLSVSGALCAFIVALMSNSKSKLKIIFYSWLEINWINFSLLFFESTDRLPSFWRARLVMITWLFTALLMSVEVGSYLKSSFATTTYDLIDRYQDALPYDDITFRAISFNPAKSVRCSQEEEKNYPKPCYGLYYAGFDGGILRIPENSRNHPGGKEVLLIMPTDLKRLVQNGYRKIRQSGRLFYLGQSSVDVFIYKVIKYKLRRNQFLLEQLMKSSLVIVENKPWAYEDFEGDYMLQSILWRKPTEEGTELYLEDCFVIFHLWLIGMTISCAVFLIEICFYFANKKKSQASRISYKIQFVC